MLELLVAIGVIGVLAALLLPAVQASREASRRVQCLNHFRQLTLAMQSHVDVHGHFPNRWNGSPADLLPYLDQQPLFELIEGRIPPHGDSQPEYGVTVFVCPSDPETIVSVANVNYLLNGGTRLYGSNGISTNSSKSPVRARDVTDGLSATSAVSERLFSIGRHQLASLRQHPPDRDNPRYTWHLTLPASTEDEFVIACRDHRVGPLAASRPYQNPLVLGHPPYSHLLPPNSVGCFNSTLRDPQYTQRPHGVTATSLHPGGVNVGFCDGHARFVNQNVDLAVWQAIGTRNGQETNSGSY